MIQEDIQIQIHTLRVSHKHIHQLRVIVANKIYLESRQSSLIVQKFISGAIGRQLWW